jgi:hypothetical protein
MALPQQLPGVSVVPQAPQVDPRLFAPDAAGMLLSARAGVQLGTELAGLQNLQSRLTLEKAEIAAKKAKNEYDRQAAEQAVITLPQMVQQQLAQAQAATAQAQASIPTFQPLAGAAIAEAGAKTAGSQFSQAQTEAGIKAGLPQFTTDITKLGLEDKQRSLLANVNFSGLSTPKQAEAVALATETGKQRGAIEGKLEAAQAASIQPSSPPAPFYLAKPGALSQRTEKSLYELPFSPLIEYRTAQIEDPITKEVVQKTFAYSTLNGARVPSADRPDGNITIRRGDSPDAKKVIALDQTLKLAEDAKGALKLYADENRGGYWQTVAADYANTPAKGLASIGTRAFGTWLQSTETASINSKLAALSNTIIKDLSGSGVTGDEFSRLTTMLPTTGDLVNPKAAQAKLDETIKYINTLAEPYKKRKSDTQSRLGNLSDQAAPASVGQGLLGVTGRRGQVKELNGRKYEFVVLPSGLSGWKAQ